MEERREEENDGRDGGPTEGVVRLIPTAAPPPPPLDANNGGARAHGAVLAILHRHAAGACLPATKEAIWRRDDGLAHQNDVARDTDDDGLCVTGAPEWSVTPDKRRLLQWRLR
ncbi:unnamed protein product [Caenorhabditis sp. 36 PRJEB53466]|nr:unnamed protein product [Caenorhabditis sp. 36 PRJEB53466]